MSTKADPRIVNKMWQLMTLFLLILCNDYGRAQLNNVCKTVNDYATIDVNPNCWYNPDVGSTTDKMVRRRGYPFRSYPVTTEDGYQLSLYRIPHNNKNKTMKRQPICILHGLFQTSEFYVMVGNRSVGFTLVEAGYDVWLANFRGTPHSFKHKYFPENSPEYWNFTWYEMGIYDLPAIISKIGTVTQTKGELILLGQTMGPTITFVYTITHQREAEEKLAGLIGFTPVGYFTDVASPLINFYVPFHDVFETILTLFGVYGLFQYRRAQQLLFSLTCGTFPYMRLCETVLFLIIGFDYAQLLPEDIPLVFSMVLTGTSVKLLTHYIQQYRAGGRLQKFDYGRAENLKMYGTALPPELDVSRITIPTHLLYGERDAVATPPAIKKFYNDLKTVKSITKISPDGKYVFNHLDFTYAKDLKTAFYPSLFKVLETLKK